MGDLNQDTVDPGEDALDLDMYGDDGAPDDDFGDDDPGTEGGSEGEPDGGAAGGDEPPGEDGTTGDDDSVLTVTIDGKKVPVSDLDPDTIRKMATHYNQVGHYQKLADERNNELQELHKRVNAIDQERRQVLDEWTRFKMQQEQANAQANEPEQAPRPSTEQLKGAFSGYLNALHQNGVITDDELDEHGGLIANYLYDNMTTSKLIQDVALHFDQRLRELEDVAPRTARTVEENQAQERAMSVQTEAASVQGYESLKDPEVWARLTDYITDRVLASPKDANGNPTFDPVFDAPTMRAMYDAMEGAILREALRKQQANAAGERKRETQRGTEARGGGAGGKRKPAPRSPGDRTPEEEALDFSDPMYAAG